MPEDMEDFEDLFLAFLESEITKKEKLKLKKKPKLFIMRFFDGMLHF